MDSPLSAEEITWPDSGELIINNTRIATFEPLKNYSSLHKRKDTSFTFDLKKSEQC